MSQPVFMPPRMKRTVYVALSRTDLLDVGVPGGTVTEAGLRANVSVGIQYLASWLRGVGAAAIDNLMEDAATSEISRSQVWQWIHHRAELDGGGRVTRDLAASVVQDELDRTEAAWRREGHVPVGVRKAACSGERLEQRRAELPARAGYDDVSRSERIGDVVLQRWRMRSSSQALTIERSMI